MPFITTIDSGEKNLTIFNKAQYNKLENITNDNDIPHKKYVDDAVAAGGGGSGSGFPLTQNESAAGFLITNLGTAINSGDSLNLGTADNRYLKLTSGTTQTVNSDVTVNGTLQGSRFFGTAGGSQDVCDIHSQSGTGKALEVHKVAGSGVAQQIVNDGSNIALEINHNTVSNSNPALKIVNASSSASIDAGSGKIINVSNATNSNDAVNKSQLDLKADSTALNSYVLKAGDTMTGNLTIPNGTVSGHAVNKSQLDLKADSTALNSYVLKAGDTMTGNLTIPNGVSSGHAVNKSQLDLKADSTALNSYVLKAGDTMTGNLTIPNGVSSGHAVNKSQLDLKADTSALSNYALLTGATFSGNITIPVATAGGHAINRDTADVRYVNSTGDTMSNTLTMSGGNIIISSGVLQQQWTTSGTNQFERPISLGANATITQNTSAPTNTLGPSTITSLTTNNQTELATGGATQTAMGGTIATSTNNEDNAQHIIRLNSTASTTGANSIIRHFRRHTTHDANWKLMKSLTDGSAAKGTNFGYALTADSHENVRLKWFPSSTVASDQDLITFTRSNITFNQAPSWGVNPSSTDHLARKAYVDSVAGNAVKTNLNNQVITPTTPANANTLQIEANGVGGSAVISYTSNVSNNTATHRILNLGTGDCLRVEDSSSDSSLVRVDNSGRMGVNVGTGTLTNTFEAISQGNATAIRLNNDIELSSHADIYLGAGGLSNNRPNCRITFRGSSSDPNLQTFYLQLGNITANAGGKFSFCKWASNEATLNICPEIRTVALGSIDSSTTAVNEQLGIWADVTKATIRFLGSAKNSGVPAMDINSQGRIINCLDPTSAQDVATKNYVDTGVSQARVGAWSSGQTQMQWTTAGQEMFISHDNNSYVLTRDPLLAVNTYNNFQSNYCELLSISNVFSLGYTGYAWYFRKGGTYRIVLECRHLDGQTNEFSVTPILRTSLATATLHPTAFFPGDTKSYRRWIHYEKVITVDPADYINFIFNYGLGTSKPIVFATYCNITLTMEYIGGF
jgi:hypothetical protein